MRKNFGLYALVLICSVMFSGGCGGGGSEPATPHKYEQYGVVETRGPIWLWIGVNETFTADSTDAVFTEDGEAVEDALEKGKSYYFVDKNAYRHFVPRNRSELVSLQLPDTSIEEVGNIGATVTVLMDWVVGSNNSNHLTVHAGRSLAARKGAVVLAESKATIWVHDGPEQPHPYSQWGEVKYVNDSLIWWEVNIKSNGLILGPEHLAYGEDGKQVTQLTAGNKYYFVAKNELEEFLPLRREELKELLHPKDFGNIETFDEFGANVPTPVHFWTVPDHPAITIHFGSSTKAAPGTKVDGAFTAWVVF